MRTKLGLVALAMAGGLASCSGGREDAPVDEPTETASENGAENGKGEEAVSILRPDLKRPVVEEPSLEPLNLVIGFPDGGSGLSAGAVATLKEAASSEQIKLGLPIVVGGHSDASGNDAANQRASLARAEAVRDWLVENGVAESRITTIAFGEQNPVEPNALPNGEPNEAGRDANRRVEVLINVPQSNVAAQSDGGDGAGAEDQEASN